MSEAESVSYSSSDESIAKSQARKLFDHADVDKKGFIVKSDIQQIKDLLSTDHLKLLEDAIDGSDDKFMAEKEFVLIISSLCKSSDGNSPEEVIEKPLFTYVSGEPSSLADELNSAEKMEVPYEDPVVQMLKEQMDSYPYTVHNSEYFSSPNNFPSPVTIKKPLYRPIEPIFSPGAASLADELNEVENPSSTAPSMDHLTPDRIFKVVFVGDSAVGKTCFLHRFCHNRFKPLFNATIGVDFTVKTITLADRIVALQLWDTAGQERFRSITKQYFRKADGVILMFDVTSEQSFIHVRNWIDSVKAGVDESTVMCLVGNKVDLFGNATSRNAVVTEASRLAQEFGMRFYETSAFTGAGIEYCMTDMAEKLQKREEDHLEEALRLEHDNNSNKRRSWCCL